MYDVIVIGAGSVDFARKLGIALNGDNIIVDRNMQTNIPGILACGNAIGGLQQISKAVYDGTVAGIEVSKIINKMH